MMKTFSIVVAMGLSFLLSATSVEAGALREMMMAKKAKEAASQSASSTTTTPANAATVTPAATQAQADPKPARSRRVSSKPHLQNTKQRHQGHLWSYCRI